MIYREFGRALPRAAMAALALGAAALASPAIAAGTVAQEAQALINSGQASEALSKLDSHLSSKPEDAEARFARGLALAKLNRTKDAIRAFADLTRDYPALPEPYNNLAVLYAGQGEYEKARDALKAAVSRHPGYAVAHENLGDIYTALASAAYAKVVALDSSNRSAPAKLATLKQIDSGLAASSVAAISPRPSARPVAPPPVEAPLAAAPAAAPSPAPASSGGDGTRHQAGLAAIQSWAQAWASKDFDTYFAAYAPDFSPEGGVSREVWEAQRRDRISRPSKIKVGVIDPTVTDIEDGGLRISFRQAYQSDAYSDTTNKVVELSPIGGQWKIVREYAR